MTDTGCSALLRHQGFSALPGAQLLGAFNDNLCKIVVSLIAVATAFGVDAGGRYLSLAGAVSYILLSGYAGVVADVHDKRTILIASRVIEVAVMALALAALIAGRIEALLATLFLMAVQSVFFSPAKVGPAEHTTPRFVEQANASATHTERRRR